MKPLITTLMAAFSVLIADAGDVTDLGLAPKVPDWAVGPLLVVPMERIEHGHLKAKREDCLRIGTVQAKSIELFGRRFTLASIHISEIGNDAKICELETAKEHGGHYYVHLSQSLFDQTFYHVLIEWVDEAGKKPAESQQFAVWDAKSRK